MKKRVLIVEDSILMQKVIGDIIGLSSEFEVCGYAKDVTEGWAKFNKLRPEIVTLDYELPGENGLVLLKKIMSTQPTPVLMLSAHTREGAEVTLEALQLGAVDFFTKPSGTISIDVYNYKEELLNKLRVVARARIDKKFEHKVIKPVRSLNQFYIGIASSTGGVRALNYLIPLLPLTKNITVLVVQHMPKYFTASLAVRLNERSSLVVKEANSGDAIDMGQVFVAPGGHHIRVDETGERLLLIDEPPRHGIRPSADILFESMARAFGEKTIGIILTGMGVDGAQGIKEIKKRGGITIAQDPKDAVIGGMPKSAIDTGYVDYVLSLHSIPDKIFDLLAQTKGEKRVHETA